MTKSKDVITQIKKATRRKFTVEEKIRTVLEGFRGEVSISEIRRREGIASSVYYKWSKAFLEAGKNGLTRDATSDQVKQLRQENNQLKQPLAEAILEVQRYKKSFGL